MLEHIRAALEMHLAGMTPAIQTAWENVQFEPTEGTPYQRVNLLPLDPVNPDHQQQTIIDRGIFQVLLSYPQGYGPVDAQARASAIRSRFAAGTVLTSGGYSVRVEATPTISQGFIDQGRLVDPNASGSGRYIVPVSIRFICIH